MIGIGASNGKGEGGGHRGHHWHIRTYHYYTKDLLSQTPKGRRGHATPHACSKTILKIEPCAAVCLDLQAVGVPEAGFREREGSYF